MEHDFGAQAEALLALYRQHGLKIATAESCTGGLVAATLTDIAGSSDVFERGFVTYSNEAKQAMLGVPETLLARFGAVSAEVARAMARGALRTSRADAAVAITGVAGPGGGTVEKPVGLVHFAVARRGGEEVHVEQRFDAQSRREIRMAAIAQALTMLRELIEPAAASSE